MKIFAHFPVFQGNSSLDVPFTIGGISANLYVRQQKNSAAVRTPTEHRPSAFVAVCFGGGRSSTV